MVTSVEILHTLKKDEKHEFITYVRKLNRRYKHSCVAGVKIKLVKRKLYLNG
jgi:hypothetical protein